MRAYCRGCVNHHNARHPKGSALAGKYNDWCVFHNRQASKAAEHCRLTGGKLVVSARKGEGEK